MQQFYSSLAPKGQRPLFSFSSFSSKGQRPLFSFSSFSSKGQRPLFLANESEWLIATYFSSAAATNPEFSELRKQAQEASLEAQREDDVICEAVQRARRSPVHHSFIYSPFWEAMHHDFNKMVLDDLERGESGLSTK